MKCSCNPLKGATPVMVFRLPLICFLAVLVHSQDLQKGPSIFDIPADEPFIERFGDAISITAEQAAALKSAAAAVATATAAAIAPQQAAPPLYAGILAAHNEDRAMNGAPPLTWSADLAASSAAWAAQCIFQHSAAGGENLYVTSLRGDDATALSNAIQGWYAEGENYDYTNAAFNGAFGHFTQVVWKSTTQLGCAAQDCNNIQGFMAGTIVVCQYSPPGNMVGQFLQNVLPPNSTPAPTPTPTPSSPPPTGPGGNFPPFNPSSVLPSGKMIRAGKGCIFSASGNNRLCVLGTGEVVVQTLRSTGAFTKSWSNRVKGPITGKKPFALALTNSGNLVAMDANNKRYWQTRTSGTGPFILIVTDTGNLVLYDSTGTCTWSAMGDCSA